MYNPFLKNKTVYIDIGTVYKHPIIHQWCFEILREDEHHHNTNLAFKIHHLMGKLSEITLNYHRDDIQMSKGTIKIILLHSNKESNSLLKS